VPGGDGAVTRMERSGVKSLFALPPADGNLTDRQTLVLQLLRDNPDGLRSSDLGAFIHQATNAPCPCSHDARCKYAMAEGERVGKQLRKRDLAIKRKTGRWQLTRPPAQGYDPTSSTIPF
jgi:hypothetical protein